MDYEHFVGKAVVVRVLDLPRLADTGVVLMAISPGAPVALRRSLAAGGHRTVALETAAGLAALVIVPYVRWRRRASKREESEA